jgi:hypothetical protein
VWLCNTQLTFIPTTWYIWYDMMYLLTAIGLPPGGGSTVHIYTQTIQRTTQKFWKSAGRAPSLRVIPWHLPYSWGKKRGKTSLILVRNAPVLKQIWFYRSCRSAPDPELCISTHRTHYRQYRDAGYGLDDQHSIPGRLYFFFCSSRTSPKDPGTLQSAI